MTLELDLTLAEALVERKALRTRVDNLRDRLAFNARVQEGDAPAEDPQALMAEVQQVMGDLERLIVAINRTNVAARLAGEDAPTLMEAIARRDVLALRQTVLENTITAARTTRDRWAMVRNEVRSQPTVDVAQLQKEVDALAKDRRELDTRLQAANWATRLVV